MAIARSGTGQVTHNTTAASSEVVTLPTGTRPGDIIIIFGSWNGTSGAAPTAPAGWTVVPNTALVGATGVVPSACFYAFQTISGLSNPTLTGPSSAVNTVGSVAYSGVGGVSNNSKAQGNSASTTITFPTVSTDLNGEMVVAIGDTPGGADNFTAVSNSFSLYLSPTSQSGGVADKLISAAGAIGATTMTQSVSSKSYAAFVLLIPADDPTQLLPIPLLPQGGDLESGRSNVFFALNPLWNSQIIVSAVPPQPVSWPLHLNTENEDRRPYTFVRHSTELGSFAAGEINWPFWTNSDQKTDLRPYMFNRQSAELGSFNAEERHWNWWNLLESQDIRPFTFFRQSAGELGNAPGDVPKFAFWQLPQTGQIVVIFPFQSPPAPLPLPPAPPQPETWNFWNLNQTNDTRPHAFNRQSTELGHFFAGEQSWPFWVLKEDLDIKFLSFFYALVMAGVVPASPAGLQDAIVIWRERGGF